MMMMVVVVPMSMLTATRFRASCAAVPGSGCAFRLRQSNALPFDKFGAAVLAAEIIIVPLVIEAKCGGFIH